MTAVGCLTYPNCAALFAPVCTFVSHLVKMCVNLSFAICCTYSLSLLQRAGAAFCTPQSQHFNAAYSPSQACLPRCCAPKPAATKVNLKIQ